MLPLFDLLDGGHRPGKVLKPLFMDMSLSDLLS